MLVFTPVRTVPRFDRIALAQAASAAPARAAGVVPRAAVGLLYVFLEDACLLLAVVICVREPSQTLLRGVDRECEGKDAASRSLRRRYHHLYLSLCGLDNNGSVRDISPRSWRLLGAGRDHRPAGLGCGCRDRRRRASG